LIIYLQNLLLEISPGLIPLLVFPISFFQSWHCVFMCGSLQANKSKVGQNNFLQGRIIGYSISGATYGYFGKKLTSFLEYQALGALAYFLFVILTLTLIAQWMGWFNISSKKHKSCMQIDSNKSTSSLASFGQGLLMTFIPCHLLFQIFGLAILTGSVAGGFLVGLVHGLSSTPALWWGQRFVINNFKTKKLVIFLKLLLAILLIFNLIYFSSKWLNPADDVKSKILFCL
jgi:sulfite exporter TauE/SafE